MSSISNSRLVQETADQKLLDGTQQVLSKLTTMTVGSQSLAPADIVKIFQDRIASSQAVQTATAARSAAVKADRDKRTQTAPLVKAFKRVVQGMFSESPDTLAVFGLQPVKAGTTTVATKAAAAQKAVATRVARHTMGKVQKKDIHGTPPSASTGSTAAPAPAPAPVATPAPVGAPAPVVATPAPAKAGPAGS
jgi:translation initiation factor IF-2